MTRGLEPGDDAGLRRHVPAAARYDEDHSSLAERFRSWRKVQRHEPMPSYLGVVEGPYENSYAVCCSGGGVRSAAFNLGALQVLSGTPYLRQARYVAAVSGGSYIAAAIAMVSASGSGGSDERLLRKQFPFAPGSPEEQYLRNRSSYMAPGPAGKVRLALRVVVGLLVNLLLILTFLAVVGALLGLLYEQLFPRLVNGRVPGRSDLPPCQMPVAGRDCEFQAVLSPALYLPTLALVGAGLFCAGVSIVVRLRERLREQWETWGVRLLAAAAILAAVLIALPLLVEVARDLDGRAAETTTEGKPPVGVVGTVGFLGTAGVLLTALLQLRARVDEPRACCRSSAACAASGAASAPACGCCSRMPSPPSPGRSRWSCSSSRSWRRACRAMGPRTGRSSPRARSCAPSSASGAT